MELVRCQVVMGYMVGVAAMLAAFYFTPSSMPQLQWATVFMIGFFLYGPQMLIGLCGAELARPPQALVSWKRGFTCTCPVQCTWQKESRTLRAWAIQVVVLRKMLFLLSSTMRCCMAHLPASVWTHMWM